MPEHDLDAAINYWVESVSILDQFKLLVGERLFDLPYERLTSEPESSIEQLLTFVGEAPEAYPSSMPNIHGEQNKFRERLSDEQVEKVLARTEPYLSKYGYGRPD
jgi:hypothetical protein